MESITGLIDELENLPAQGRNLFDSIFRIWRYTGHLKVPPSFRSKIREYYGERGEDECRAIERIKMQTIVNTFNIWTGEAALFNQLRAGRPRQNREQSVGTRERLFSRIEQAKRGCDFCDPVAHTPEDVFGRIKGKHCITASNIAKYDAYNAVVIFNRHNPLEFDRKEFFDYVDVGLEWCRKVHEHDQDFKYPFFTWNCLEKAGASQIHGHAQVLVARKMPYAKVLALSEVSQRYKRETKMRYFDVLYKVHESVGLAVMRKQIKVLMYLTPIKEKEMMIVSSSMSADLKSTMFKVLRSYIDELGVMSFNLSIAIPPIGTEDGELPIIARIVDRGDVFSLSSDFGGMELYGTSVLASDPCSTFRVARRSIEMT
ncbi:MAG: hypothetical protein AM324_002650 [Candidatus Thorarchaeota archaeon SMTZ1-83]|nr:MAG: hypothetical protein AM324_03660 [Candidatus Thorarchaeota archaeon SMTZ1-83]